MKHAAPHPRQVAGVGMTDAKSGWRMGPARHADHELIILLEGKKRAIIGGTEYSAQPGDVLSYPAGVEHYEENALRRPLRTVFISWRGTIPFTGYKLSDESGRIRTMARWMFEEPPAPEIDQRRLLYLELMLDDLCRPTGAEAELVRRLRTFMRAHLAEPLTLAHLAREAHLSPYHFLRRWRELTGQPPMSELRRLRVETARTMLVTTTTPIKEVADQVGIANEFHLSRLFRKLLHTTPGSVRRGR